MKNIGGKGMSEKLKRKIVGMVSMKMTPEAEDVFYEAVCDYVYRLGRECSQLASDDGRKTIAKGHVEVVLEYLMK